MCQHLTVARVAEGLAVSWNTANDAVLAEGTRVLINDRGRFDGVAVIGVDEHVWRHTRRGDKYVTVIIDLTGVRTGTGPARLLDMVKGRSKQAFQQWLEDKSHRGQLDHLGALATVRLYRNDRQVKQVSYREIEADQPSYTVDIRLIAPSGHHAE